MSKKPTFRTNPIVNAIGLATTLLSISGTAHAGVGFVSSQDTLGNPIRVQTYFSSTPRGLHDTVIPEAATVSGGLLSGVAPVDSGKALRKFIDPLPLVGVPQTLADGVTSKYIPLAVPEKWVNPQGVTTTDDYYELACIEYSEKFHTDLRKASTLRGYVQLSTVKTPGKALNLYYPNSSGQVAVPAGTAMPADALPIMIQASDANNKLMFDAAGKPIMKQAQAVDYPHYLGPALVNTKDTPTRVKFLNLLPVGRAVVSTAKDASGNLIVTKRNGDLPIPVDTSLVGAGFGPDGVTTYTQNRISIHNHGGDTPWISDGTALQWWTPAGEADPTIPGSLASKIADPAMLANYLRGSSAKNVPDMNDPGPGGYTFYYPNGNTARLQWYHDHAAGITRLNAYIGMAAPYVISDASETDLVTRGVIPGPADTVYLVLQDKGFVPDDIALQDQRWNTTAWGAPGDFYYAHVYETVQDPKQLNSWNPVGRWHYGPWFWPVFPALYPLPTGAYQDETVTPENWMDTPVINGVAYPVLNVEPKAYRFRILNGSNDRGFTFNLFKADTTKPSPWSDPTNPLWDGVTTTPNYGEVPMVPASVPTDPCLPGTLRSYEVAAGGAGTAQPGSGLWCTPDSWAFDGRNGGVPAPGAQGPTMYQIGNEAGWLANVAEIESAPTVPLYDVGRVTVLNVNTTGLWLGNAERADLVVDFSAYANTTLIAYNDMFAATPAGDPRNDYFTGIGDQSQQGGSEDTKLGYGPNIRTMMQIRVAPAVTTPGIAFNPATLHTEIPKAYGATHSRPIVAQSAYNAAFGTAWTDTQAWASIFTGSLKQPAFNFVPGSTSAFNGVTVTAGGSGYTTAPAVAITGGGGTGATAAATLKISKLTVATPGSGYTVAPTVSINTVNGYTGSGATATTTLGVATVNIVNAGAGYTAAPTVTFSMPQGVGGVQAKGTATISGGKVTGVTITTPGSGYLGAPVVTFSAPTGAGAVRATGTTTGGVATLTLTSADPTNPAAAGGGGYNDLVNGISFAFTPNATTAGIVAPTVTATGSVMDVTIVKPGTGFTALPTISLSGGGGTGATASASAMGSILVKTKAIQELFDPTYGRLNATLGVETPFTSALAQTTIPLGFIDPPTEVIKDGETQIWKITHNGVDTHPVHFHLMDVQVVNRVGWDGFISPPFPNEIGWKETVKMSPLEDIIIAVRPKKHNLPAGVGAPISIRPLDETQPLGSPFGFTQVDPNSGLPAVVVNSIQNFGWEYTWHCHILGHEENDFMRPVVLDVVEAVPTAPSGFGVVVPLFSFGQPYAGITLNWTDTSSTEYKFEVLRGVGATGALSHYADVPANMGTFLDTNVVSQTTYRYQVVAVGGQGSNATAIVNATTPILPPTAPASLTAVESATTTAVTLTWNDASSNETGFVVSYSSDGGLTWSANVTVASTGANVANIGRTVTYTTPALTADKFYLFRVAAVGAGGTSNWTQTAAPGLLVAGIPTAPTAFTTVVQLPVAPATTPSALLSWTDASLSEVSWTVQRATVTGGRIGTYAALAAPNGSIVSTTQTTTGTVYTLNDTTAVNGTIYSYRIQAANTRGTSAWVVAPNLTVAVPPNAPTNVLATPVAGTTNQFVISWVDGSTDETGYTVTGTWTNSAGVTSTVNVGTVTVAAGAARTGTGTTVSLPAYSAAGGTWVFNVVANGALGTVSTVASSAPVTSIAPPILAPANVTATAASVTSVTLNWTDMSNNETLFRIQRAPVVGGVVGAFAQVGTVTSTAANGTAVNRAVTFTDTTAAFNTTYVYQVQAESALNVSGYVQSAQVSTVISPLTGLTVVAATTNTALLSWVDGALETGYRIERSTNGGTTFTTLGTTAANATSFSAPGMRAGTAYVFRVTPLAVIGGVTYLGSPVTVNFTMAAPLPAAAPTGVAVTGITTTTATINWIDASTIETSFIVEGCAGTCTAASAWTTYGTVASAAANRPTTGTALSFLDTGLRTKTTYSYRVVPMNGTQRGTPSAIVTITTL
ncbi:MAG: fibronectin type III domain-containing protein [Leptothrix sp. (in: b-proteobacteria)]